MERGGDDADVVVGDERERPAARVLPGDEHDRAGVGDRQRGAGDDRVERVELGDRRGRRPRSRRGPRSRKPAGTPTRCALAEDGSHRGRRRRIPRRGGRSRGTRRRARRTDRRSRRGGASRRRGTRAGSPGLRRRAERGRIRARMSAFACSRAASGRCSAEASVAESSRAGSPSAVLPPVAERLLGRLGEVAHRGPAGDGGLRQRPAAEPRQPLRGLVAAAGGERRGHALHGQRLGRELGLLLAHDAPAQVDEDRRDVDLDRADLVTGAAQRRRPRQRRRLSRARCSCGVRIAPIGPG